MDNSNHDIPPSLEDRLEEEQPEERRRLTEVWRLLGTLNGGKRQGAKPRSVWKSIREQQPAIAVKEHDSARSKDSLRQRTDAPPQTPNRTRRERWIGVSGLALLAVACAVWALLQPETITVPDGKQRTITLTEGVTMELNSGTRVSFPSQTLSSLFGSYRTDVQLRGEAFFVVEQRQRPLIVETFNARIVVRGTQFGVQARPSVDSTTEVALVEGKIKVSSEQDTSRAAVMNKKGSLSRVRDSKLDISFIESERLDTWFAWRNGGFAVTGKPLWAVVKEIERRYDVQIRIGESVDRTASVTLYYPDPTFPDTVLSDLSAALGLEYDASSGQHSLISGGGPE